MNLGTVSGGRSWRADVRLVHEAVDRGVRVFDTADAYGNGASERIVGRALGGRRDQVEIATKGGYLFRERSRPEVAARRLAKEARDRLRSAPEQTFDHGPGDDAQDVSARHLRAALDASLRRLQTDHVDVYQLHGPRQVRPELLDDLQDLVSAGKVGRFGVGAESLDSAVGWSAVDGIDVVQMPVGVLDPEAVD
ncbi:MAG: aldo/keto reductase, partial [Ilumatobacteraceae bacterium]